MPHRSVLAYLAVATPLLVGTAPDTDKAITEILAANRLAMASGGCRSDGTLEQDLTSINATPPATMHSVMDRRTGRYADWRVTGPVRTGEGFDGRVVWQQDASGTIRLEAGGEIPALAISQAYLGANSWWANDRSGAAISDAGSIVDEGRRYVRLTVTPLLGQTFTAWFDSSTHLLARIVEKVGAATTTTVYSDYRVVEGCRRAGKVMIDGGDGDQYRETYTLTRAKSSAARPQKYFGPPPTSPRDFIFDSSGRTSVPFRLEGNHIVFDAKVNGKGPFTMILDSGGQTVLTVSTAKTLAVQASGNMAVGGVGNGVGSSGYAQDLELEIGGLKLKNQIALVMELPSLPPPAHALQGMLGYELLRRVIVEIDYSTNTLTFSDPTKLDKTRAGVAVPFDYAYHMPEVAGSFEGIKGRFRIDTGSGSELVISSPAVQQYRLRESHPTSIRKTSTGGIGGAATVYMTRSDDLRLGAVRFDHVVTSLSSQRNGAFADPSYTGNVGGGLLKRYAVTFDYPAQTIYFRQRVDAVDDTGTYDRAGLSLKPVAGGLVIDDVVAGGPAAAIDLRPGDVLVAVDGKRKSATELTELRYFLRNTPVDTRVRIDVLRNGVPLVRTLVLKDQI